MRNNGHKDKNDSNGYNRLYAKDLQKNRPIAINLSITFIKTSKPPTSSLARIFLTYIKKILDEAITFLVCDKDKVVTSCCCTHFKRRLFSLYMFEKILIYKLFIEIFGL